MMRSEHLAAVATATKFEGKHLAKEALTVSIKTKLNRVAQQWMNEELEKTEEAWAGNGAIDLDDVDDYKDIHCDQLEEATEALQQNQQWKVKDLADELVSQHSLPVEKGSTDYGRLCRELLKAKVELLQEEIRRLNGDFQPRPSIATPSAASLLPSVPAVVPAVRDHRGVKTDGKPTPHTLARDMRSASRMQKPWTGMMFLFMERLA